MSSIREIEDEEHIDSLQKRIDDMALEIVASSANNQSPKTRDIVYPLPFHDLVLRKEQVHGVQMASIEALEAPFDPSEHRQQFTRRQFKSLQRKLPTGGQIIIPTSNNQVLSGTTDIFFRQTYNKIRTSIKYVDKFLVKANLPRPTNLLGFNEDPNVPPEINEAFMIEHMNLPTVPPNGSQLFGTKWLVFDHLMSTLGAGMNPIYSMYGIMDLEHILTKTALALRIDGQYTTALHLAIHWSNHMWQWSDSNRNIKRENLLVSLEPIWGDDGRLERYVRVSCNFLNIVGQNNHIPLPNGLCVYSFGTGAT